MRRGIRAALCLLLLLGAACSPTSGAPGTGPGQLVVDLEGMPVYPGAEAAAEVEAAFREVAAQSGGPMREATIRSYTTGDEPALVLSYYEVEMARRGWRLDVSLADGEGGVIQWQKGPLLADLLVSSRDGHTQILLSWGQPVVATPTLTPAAS